MDIRALDPTRGAATLALALALALSGCGGGGGNPGAVGPSGSTGSSGGSGGTTVPATPTVTLALLNASGQSSNALSGGTPLTARATVRDQAGHAVANALVAFATDNAMAVFSPTSGTALTDANGVASVTMRAASLNAGGAAKVSATSTVAGASVSGDANFSVGATVLAFGTLSAAPASIQAYESTLLSVDLLAGGTKYTSQPVNVSFSSACVAAGKATLAATVPTNNGTAQAVYRDQGCGNNDVVTVAADGVAQAASTTVTIAPPAAASVQFLEASPVDKSIVIKGQGGINRTETASLKFKVVDTFGHALAGKSVHFSASTADVTVNKTDDTTDQNGEVITTVNSGAVPTSFRVQAALPGTGIATFSDSIVVTSGLPVQRALSLSTNVTAVESAYDNPNAATVMIMLADQFGNPVPDGTPVVFQTNLGAIGTSDKGGCNTVNGLCTVPFRTQNPRVAAPNLPATVCNDPNMPGSSSDSTRPGLATICASTTDGSNTLFAKTTMFFSGSFATQVYMLGGYTPLSTSVATDLGSVKFDQGVVFTVEINDSNQNPMPTGTTVNVNNVTNAKVAVAPDTVQNLFPHSSSGVDDPTGVNVSGRQGSLHTITVASTTAAPCAADAAAAFNLTITTPKGNVTSYPFKLKFTCQ